MKKGSEYLAKISKATHRGKTLHLQTFRSAGHRRRASQVPFSSKISAPACRRRAWFSGLIITPSGIAWMLDPVSDDRHAAARYSGEICKATYIISKFFFYQKRRYRASKIKSSQGETTGVSLWTAPLSWRAAYIYVEILDKFSDDLSFGYSSISVLSHPEKPSFTRRLRLLYARLSA